MNKNFNDKTKKQQKQKLHPHHRQSKCLYRCNKHGKWQR